MKKTIIICLISLLGITVTSNAQNKTAYLNFNALIQAMPETKTVSTQLEKITQDYQLQLEKMTAEFKEKNEAFEKEKETLQVAIKDFKLKELIDLQKKFEEFKQAAQTDIQKKREELLNPIIKKAKDAVEVVAKEKGYGYVADSSGSQYIYMNPNDNIMDFVKKKLGL